MLYYSFIKYLKLEPKTYTNLITNLTKRKVELISTVPNVEHKNKRVIGIVVDVEQGGVTGSNT